MTGTSKLQSPNPFLAAFEDPAHVEGYAEGPRRFTPGLSALHLMASILLREQARADAHVLVHGAGGGLELRALADENPGWSFTGVDPARAMLDKARSVMGIDASRVQFHHGYIDDAPEGPFDGATSFLTLHFLNADDRRNTVAEIVQRLKPGAPLVVAHSSFPQSEPDRSVWLTRYAQFALSSGAEPTMVQKALQAVTASDTMFDPGVDEQILESGGLRQVELFYAAFTWRGWVGYAP